MEAEAAERRHQEAIQLHEDDWALLTVALAELVTLVTDIDPLAAVRERARNLIRWAAF